MCWQWLQMGLGSVADGGGKGTNALGAGLEEGSDVMSNPHPCARAPLGMPWRVSTDSYRGWVERGTAWLLWSLEETWCKFLLPIRGEGSAVLQGAQFLWQLEELIAPCSSAKPLTGSSLTLLQSAQKSWTALWAAKSSAPLEGGGRCHFQEIIALSWWHHCTFFWGRGPTGGLHLGRESPGPPLDIRAHKCLSWFPSLPLFHPAFHSLPTLLHSCCCCTYLCSSSASISYGSSPKMAAAGGHFTTAESLPCTGPIHDRIGLWDREDPESNWGNHLSLF